MRGQAFLVFKSSEQAVTAKEALNGFIFFSKPIRITFAKNPSFATLVDEGKFIYQDYKNNQQKTNKDSKKQLRNVLVVANLPPETTSEYFTFLFKQFPGLQQARVLPEKSVGLVEFLNEKQASVALKAINGFKWGDNFILKVDFAQEQN